MSKGGDRHAELSALATRLGLHFEDLELLDRALTHASACAEETGPASHYESLEFVGDAALGLAVTHYIYQNEPGLTPGQYSQMRARVVNQKALSRVAARLDIAPAIRLGKGEELSGGRRRKALLADCMEAVIGAIYLENGLEAVYDFVTAVFRDELNEAKSAGNVWDFKSRLQIYCQAGQSALPQFETVSSEGPDHRKRFEVVVRIDGEDVGRGAGLTKKEAEQNAARDALAAAGQLER